MSGGIDDRAIQDCSKLLPVSAKAISPVEADRFIAELRKLDLKYDAINDCCGPRAQKISEIAKTHGFDVYLAFNLAGGLVLRETDSLSPSTAFLREWGTSIMPDIPAFYTWDSSFGGWIFHVAPMLRVQNAGGACDMIIDPALFNQSVPLKKWLDYQRDPNAKVFIAPPTRSCGPWITRECPPFDVPKELQLCAHAQQVVSFKRDLVGDWMSTDSPAESLSVSPDGDLNLSRMGKILLTAHIQHHRSELTLALDVTEVESGFAQAWPRLRAGSIVAVPYAGLTAGSPGKLVTFLTLYPDREIRPSITESPHGLEFQKIQR
jgi:hypothetical protein